MIGAHQTVRCRNTEFHRRFDNLYGVLGVARYGLAMCIGIGKVEHCLPMLAVGRLLPELHRLLVVAVLWPKPPAGQR
jgi:hypothetical protein